MILAVLSQALIGVLVGALVTLAGSVLQLWFNKRQRERERQMQLRRDVYLEAAEGLAAILDYLNQHGRVDVPLGKASPPSGAASWLFKAYLVANADTLVALTRAGTAVAGAAMDLLPHRLAVSEAEDDIALTRSKIEGLAQLQEQLRVEASAIASEAPTERALQRIQGIHEEYQLAQNDRDAEAQNLTRLVNEHARRLRILLEHVTKTNLEVQEPIRRALRAARSELELTIDEERFRRATADIDARMVEKVRKLSKLTPIVIRR